MTPDPPIERLRSEGFGLLEQNTNKYLRLSVWKVTKARETGNEALVRHIEDEYKEAVV